MEPNAKAIKGNNRRNDRRKRVEIPAFIDDCEVLITDISLGGVGGVFLPNPDNKRRFFVGERVNLNIDKDRETGALVPIVIRRVSDHGLRFGGKFLEMGERQYRVVESYLIGRSRNRRPATKKQGSVLSWLGL